MHIRHFTLFAALVATACAAGAADRIVHDADELEKALNAARGGEVIRLAEGSYPVVRLRGKAYSRAVVVTSVDPARPANIDKLRLDQVSNLTFRSLAIGEGHPGATLAELTGARVAKVEASSDISFEAVYFHGSRDGNPNNDGGGLETAKGSRNISVINCEFEQLFRAAMFGGTDGLRVIGNKVHGIRSDGFDFASVRNVLVEGNFFTDFSVIKGDHPDGIQFWTTGAKRASTDIVIRDNQIIQGSGNSMQGIFLADQQGNKPYERVTIENNIVYAAKHQNGISVLGGKDVRIVNNTAISPTGDDIRVSIRLGHIENGYVADNVSDVLMTGRNVKTKGNVQPSGDGVARSALSPATFATTKAADLVGRAKGYRGARPIAPAR